MGRPNGHRRSILPSLSAASSYTGRLFKHGGLDHKAPRPPPGVGEGQFFTGQLPIEHKGPPSTKTCTKTAATPWSQLPPRRAPVRVGLPPIAFGMPANLPVVAGGSGESPSSTLGRYGASVRRGHHPSPKSPPARIHCDPIRRRGIRRPPEVCPLTTGREECQPAAPHCRGQVCRFLRVCCGGVRALCSSVTGNGNRP